MKPYKGMTGGLFDGEPLKMDDSTRRSQVVSDGAGLLERLAKYSEVSAIPEMLFKECCAFFDTNATGVYDLLGAISFAQGSTLSLKKATPKEKANFFRSQLRTLAKKRLFPEERAGE